ncbi:hypothetical protein [Endozoicomonas sp. GU-1]|uniref:hypothetical protein n=1 Tax=Endozoicomonas sp. GU-1 TaxID=3009078 RepID=UPI0022B57C7F|nr:hypothetical protein [Endozoicomonas sp. GU-1]WBA81980.1 hypothetical protein O2T12_02090 [Endozoicomonas sp. GU-1]
MKKFDYRLARERVKLASDIVKLGTRLAYFGIAVFAFLSVAFNYFNRHQNHAFLPQMGQ